MEKRIRVVILTLLSLLFLFLVGFATYKFVPRSGFDDLRIESDTFYFLQNFSDFEF